MTDRATPTNDTSDTNDADPPDRGARPATGPTASATSVASHAWIGARDMTPMVIGVAPFAVAIGATISSSSLDPAVGLASGPLVLAGAAQLATIQMLDADSAPLVIVFSAVLINLRLLLYSTSIAPWFADLGLRRRLLLAIPVVDQLHFVCVPRFERGDLDGRARVAYYTGAAVWLVTAWLTAQTAAVVLGARVPDAARLDMAAPLALVGLLARSTGTRPTASAAVVAVGLVALCAGLPFHAAPLVATIVAIAVVAPHRPATPPTDEVDAP